MSKKKESEEYDKNFSNVAKQSSINFIGRFVKIGLSFITSILLARALGPSLLGQFRLGNTVANFMTNFTKMGFDQGLIRFIPLYKTKKEYGKIKYLILFSFLTSLVISIFIGGFIYFYSDFLAINLFNDLEMSVILKITAISILFFTYYRLSISVLKGIKRVDYLTVINYFIVPFVFLVPLLFLKMSEVFNVFLIRIVSYIIGTMIIIYVVLKKEYFLRYDFKKINLKEFFSFSSPLLFIGLVYFLISNIDILMIGFFLTSSEVGIYSIAVKVSIITVFLLRAFNSIFASVISELTEKKQFEDLKNLLKSITKLTFLFSFNFLVFIIIFNKEVLTLFGENYINGNIVLIILTLGQFVNAGVGSIGILLTMSGNQKYEFYNSIGVCIINIILNAILIPYYGIEGAAIATGLSVISINLIKLIQVRKIFGFHPYKKSFIYLILFGIITGILISSLKFFHINYVWKLTLAVIFSMICNFVLMYNFALEREDRLILNHISKRLNSFFKN